MKQLDKAPAYQWYVRDYMSDEAVALMSYEQQGIYRALLDRQWLEGSIPADPSQLAAILRVPAARFEKLWPRIAVKFSPVADGRLANGRMERERQKAEDYKRAASENGKKGAAKKWGGHKSANGHAIDSPMADSSFASAFASASAPAGKHMRRSAPRLVLAPGFLEFWAAYPKHKGRKDAEKAWNRLTPDAALQQQIQDALIWQKRSPDWVKDGGQFVPFPATYLNNRRWEDEPVDASRFAGTSARTAGNLAELQAFVAAGGNR